MNICLTGPTPFRPPKYCGYETLAAAPVRSDLVPWCSDRQTCACICQEPYPRYPAATCFERLPITLGPPSIPQPKCGVPQYYCQLGLGDRPPGDPRGLNFVSQPHMRRLLAMYRRMAEREDTSAGLRVPANAYPGLGANTGVVGSEPERCVCKWKRVRPTVSAPEGMFDSPSAVASGFVHGASGGGSLPGAIVSAVTRKGEGLPGDRPTIDTMAQATQRQAAMIRPCKAKLPNQQQRHTIRGTFRGSHDKTPVRMRPCVCSTCAEKEAKLAAQAPAHAKTTHGGRGDTSVQPTIAHHSARGSSKAPGRFS